MINKIIFLAILAFFIGCQDDNKTHGGATIIEDNKFNEALKKAEKNANSSEKTLEVVAVIPGEFSQDENTTTPENNETAAEEKAKFVPIEGGGIDKGYKKIENDAPEAIIKVPKDKLIRKLREE